MHDLPRGGGWPALSLLASFAPRPTHTLSESTANSAMSPASHPLELEELGPERRTPQGTATAAAASRPPELKMQRPIIHKRVDRIPGAPGAQGQPASATCRSLPPALPLTPMHQRSRPHRLLTPSSPCPCLPAPAAARLPRCLHRRGCGGGAAGGGYGLPFQPRRVPPSLLELPGECSEGAEGARRHQRTSLMPCVHATHRLSVCCSANRPTLNASCSPPALALLTPAPILRPRSPLRTWWLRRRRPRARAREPSASLCETS